MEIRSAGLKWPATWEANLVAASVVLVAAVAAGMLGTAGLALLLSIPQLLIVLPGAIWTLLRRYSFQQTLRLRPLEGRAALWSALIGLACWPVIAAFATLLERILSRIGPGPEIPLPATALESVVYVLVLVVVAPLTEEPIFRGFVMSAWLRRGMLPGLVVSAVLFACAHLQIAALVPIALLGVAFGFLVIRTNSLMSSILAHACYNLLGSVFIVIPSLRNPPDGPVLLAGALALPVAAWLIWSFARRFPGQASAAPAEQSSRLWIALSLLPILLILLITVVGELYLRMNPAGL